MTVIQEKRELVLDNNTGEVLSDVIETTTFNTVPTEPEFVKMYIDDLGMLKGLSGSDAMVLLYVAALANYDGEILLPLVIKEKVAEKAGVKVQTVNNAIVKFVKKRIFKSGATTQYFLNPDLFAKGKWREIRERRKAFQSITTYLPNGEKIVETNMID